MGRWLWGAPEEGWEVICTWCLWPRLRRSCSPNLSLWGNCSSADHAGGQGFTAIHHHFSSIGSFLGEETMDIEDKTWLWHQPYSQLLTCRIQTLLPRPFPPPVGSKKIPPFSSSQENWNEHDNMIGPWSIISKYMSPSGHTRSSSCFMFCKQKIIYGLCWGEIWLKPQFHDCISLSQCG